MKFQALACILLFASGCEPKAQDEVKAEPNKEATKVARQVPQEELATPMARDLNRICNAEELSGALELQPAERAMHTGIWLAQNLESQEARDLSAALTKLGPAERIARLQRATSEHGIKACEILHAWRGGE